MLRVWRHDCRWDRMLVWNWRKIRPWPRVPFVCPVWALTTAPHWPPPRLEEACFGTVAPAWRNIDVTSRQSPLCITINLRAWEVVFKQNHYRYATESLKCDGPHVTTWVSCEVKDAPWWHDCAQARQASRGPGRQLCFGTERSTFRCSLKAKPNSICSNHDNLDK